MKARHVLQTISTPVAVNAICIEWIRTRDALLGQLIERCRYTAQKTSGLSVGVVLAFVTRNILRQPTGAHLNQVDSMLMLGFGVLVVEFYQSERYK